MKVVSVVTLLNLVFQVDIPHMKVDSSLLFESLRHKSPYIKGGSGDISLPENILKFRWWEIPLSVLIQSLLKTS